MSNLFQHIRSGHCCRQLRYWQSAAHSYAETKRKGCYLRPNRWPLVYAITYRWSYEFAFTFKDLAES